MKKLSLPFSFIISFIPLTIFITSYDGNVDLIDSKFAYFSFTASLIIIIYTIISFSRPSDLSLNKIDAFLLLYYFFCLLSLIITGSPLNNDEFIIFTLLIGLFFVIKAFFLSLVQNKRQLEILVVLTSFLVIALAFNTYCLLQLYGVVLSFGADYRVTGTFHNPAQTAFFIASTIPLSSGIYLFLNAESRAIILIKTIASLVFVTGILVLPVTDNRSSWLAALAGLLIVLNHKFSFLPRIRDRFNPGIKLKIISITGAVLLLTSLLFILYHYKADSAYGRVFRWKVISSLIIEKPLTGHGFSFFHRDYNNKQAEWFATNSSDVKDELIAGNERYAYNEILETACETGITGTLLFAAIILLSIKYCFFNRGRPLSTTMLLSGATLVVILTLGMFSYPLSSLPSQINFFTCLALISMERDMMKSYEDKKDVPVKSHLHLRGFSGLFARTLFILTAIYLLILQYKKYEAKAEWKSALHFQETQSYKSAIDIYRSNYRYLNTNGKFLRDYGISLSSNGNYNQSSEILHKAAELYSDPDLYLALGNNYSNTGRMKKAEHFYLFAGSMIPHRLFPKYQLVKLYLRTGDIEKARSLQKNILKMPVKVNSPAIRQMKNDIQLSIEKYESEHSANAAKPD